MPKCFLKDCESPYHTIPYHTISNILKENNDKINEETSKGIVYKIKCKDSPSVWWPSIIIVKYVSFWGEKNKNWKETKNISNPEIEKKEKKQYCNEN